jgi:hypothetical protein
MGEMERSTRSRIERYRLMMAHRAAARALDLSLKNEAAEEYEREKVGVSWRMPGGGLVLTSLRHDSIMVTDEDAFLAWVKINYPDQVRVVEMVHSGWQAGFLGRLGRFVGNHMAGDDERDPDDVWAALQPGERATAIDPGTGAIVPGVRHVKGGGLASVGIKVDKDAERRMNVAAAAYAQGTGAMPGLESGESA